MAKVSPFGRADLHMHSCLSDGRDSPERLVEYARRLGIDVISVTDHDTLEGSLRAAKYAEGLPGAPSVVLGQEATTTGGHVLGLFLSEQLPKGLSPEQTVTAIHDQGGLAVAAHPFWHPSDPRRGGVGDLVLEIQFDAMEVINGVPVPSMWRANRSALQANAELRLPAVAGSDAHAEYAMAWAYTRFAGRNSTELKAAILTGSVEATRLPRSLLQLARYGIWGLFHDPSVLQDVLPGRTRHKPRMAVRQRDNTKSR